MRKKVVMLISVILVVMLSFMVSGLNNETKFNDNNSSKLLDFSQTHNQSVFVDVSFEEFLTYINVVHVTLFNHFDVGFNMTWGEEGLKTEISK